MMNKAQRTDSLISHIRLRSQDAGVHLDVYDPDFLLAVIEEWLGEHNMALTGNGIKRLISGVTG